MELEQRAAAPLAGGLMRGYQCGMIWGAALAGGAQATRILGKGPQAEAGAIITAQRIVESFRAQNKAIDCSEITGIDISAPTPQAIIWFLAKTAASGTCFGMAARYARAAFREINAASSEMHIESLPAPVSCSAMLAQRMGHPTCIRSWQRDWRAHRFERRCVWGPGCCNMDHWNEQPQGRG